MSNLKTADPAQLLGIIDGVKADIAPLLVENGQTFDRLRSTFSIAMREYPDLLDCTPDSIRREISKCAADGLVPDGREAVILPYYDKEQKAFVANYQPMVYGIIKRVKELGSVFNIVVELVCERDTFSFNAADPDSLEHTWDVFSKDPRGSVVASYVIFRDDQKRVMHREIMTLEELEDVRKASKAPNSPAWRNFRGEMFQKVTIRRGQKYIAINNDKIRMLLERTDAMFDFSAKPAVERVNPFGGPLIEGTVGSGDEEGKTQTDDKAPKQPPSGGRQDKPSDQPMPPLPDVEVFPGDTDKMTDCAKEILGVCLIEGTDPAGRRAALKEAAKKWKDNTPETLRDLVKAFIDIADWSIQRQDAGKPWASEHAMAVHRTKSLLGLDELSVGTYP